MTQKKTPFSSQDKPSGEVVSLAKYKAVVNQAERENEAARARILKLEGDLTKASDAQLNAEQDREYAEAFCVLFRVREESFMDTLECQTTARHVIDIWREWMQTARERHRFETEATLGTKVLDDFDAKLGKSGLRAHSTDPTGKGRVQYRHPADTL